jgi:iron-sulfur cluster assembly accessory protein
MRNFRTLQFLAPLSLILVLSLSGAFAKPADPGVEIDFKDEVMGRGFVFKNPNATSTCGCGSSFQA